MAMELLHDSVKIGKLSANALKMAKMDAAQTIIDEVYKLVKK